MSEDPNHPWGSGATTHRWTAPVSREVQAVLNRWPHVTANSYVCHPWCGWSRYSADFWGPGGRGDSIAGRTPYQIRRFLLDRNGAPWIRHTIIDHMLWTSWGGPSHWARDDHSGAVRHLHVTFWQ